MEKMNVIHRQASYNKKSDIRHLVTYVCSKKDKEERVRYWGARGYLKDIDFIVDTTDQMQKQLNKTNGRRMYHIICSFPEKFQYPEVIYVIANVLADEIGKEYQLVFGVHENTENLHIHFAINAVNYRTGLKWHKNKAKFNQWVRELQQIADGIMAEIG